MRAIVTYANQAADYFCDDGVNAAGGNEKENVEMLNITGGLIYISAQGDVIDSNGNIEMSGGVVFAQGPSRGGNGLLGFDGTFTFKGGFFFGFGGADMCQTPTKQGDATLVDVLYYIYK